MDDCLAFRLGPSILGMGIGIAVEVVTLRRVKPVPDMPVHIIGVMQVRRKLIPLVDLRTMLSISPDSKKERVLIIRSATGMVGLVVDEVLGIKKFDKEKIRRPPVIFRGLKRKYMAGLYGDGDDMIILLNMDEILTADEKLILESLIKEAKKPVKRKKTVKVKS